MTVTRQALKIAGLVLAGGTSTRMGQDKALLTLGKRSLLQRTVSLLQGQGLAKVFVSGDYPEYACISDIHRQLGPIGALHSVVTELYGHYDALFILPVDMPFLGSPECALLLQTWQRYPQGVFYQDVTFPMILPLNQVLQDYLAAAVQTSEKRQRSLYALLQTLKIQPLACPPESEFYFQNSNTPEQWARCLALYQQLAQTKDPL